MTMVINAPTEESAVRTFAAAAEAPTTHAEVSASITEVPNGVIDGGESVILAIKPSMWRPVFDSSTWLFACWVSAMVLAWFRQPLPGLSVAETSQLLVFVALVRFGIAIAHWMPRWHILTNRRIVDIRGVRSMKVDSWPLVKIRNTYVNRSTPERLTKLGTVTFVSTEQAAAAHQWRSVGDADVVHAEIRKAIENAIDHHQVTL
jgi:hypothetical protein